MIGCETTRTGLLRRYTRPTLTLLYGYPTRALNPSGSHREGRRGAFNRRWRLLVSSE